MRLLVNRRFVPVPICKKCRNMMHFHSTQAIDGVAAELPKIMLVFVCESCDRWQAVPEDVDPYAA